MDGREVVYAPPVATDRPTYSLITTNHQLEEVIQWDDILFLDRSNWKLYWKISPSRPIPIGSEAGSIDGNSYIQVEYKYKTYKAHTIIWCMCGNSLAPGQLVDHIDGNVLNNNIANLRLSCKTTNSWNRRRSNRNTSGIKGVSLRKYSYGAMYWVGNVTANGKRFTKCFEHSDEGKRCAEIWVRDLRESLHKEFANNG